MTLRRPAALTALLVAALLALAFAVARPDLARASAMVLPRAGHTATLLADGRVLVTGGTSATGAEIYDPASDSWSFTGGMRAPRSEHAAVRLADGRVLVVGSTAPTRTAEIYDPATGRWSTTSEMALARARPAAALLPDGRVLVVGGTFDSQGEIYDPATNTWTATAPSLGGVRPDAPRAATLPDGRVLVVGGEFEGVPLIELYDPRSDSWSGAPAGQPLFEAQLAPLPGGRFLIFGGISRTYALIFDPATGAVAPAPPPPLPLFDPAVTPLADGRVLLTGALFSDNGLRPAAVAFDPAQSRWLIARGPAVARVAHTATQLRDGRALLAGGRGMGATLSSAELYDPAGAILGRSTYLPLMRVAYPGPFPPGPFPTRTPFVPPTPGPTLTPGPTVTPRSGGVDVVDVVLKDPAFPNESEEYVLIANRGGSAVELRGWTLSNVSRPDQQRGAVAPFVFPAFSLGQDATVAVFSQAGANDPQLGDFFWGQQGEVWQAGDRAELRDAQGNLVAAFIVPAQ